MDFQELYDQTGIVPYKHNTYKNQYALSMRPILVTDLIPDGRTLPPDARRKPGRPRSKRYRKNNINTRIRKDSKRKNDTAIERSTRQKPAKAASPIPVSSDKELSSDEAEVQPDFASRAAAHVASVSDKDDLADRAMAFVYPGSEAESQPDEFNQLFEDLRRNAESLDREFARDSLAAAAQEPLHLSLQQKRSLEPVDEESNAKRVQPSRGRAPCRYCKAITHASAACPE